MKKDINNLNTIRKVEYYYLDLLELIPSYKREETTMDEMDNLFLKVVDNKLAVQFRALDTHRVLRTIIKESKYYKKHPELKEKCENLEKLYNVDLGERIYKAKKDASALFVSRYKKTHEIDYSPEFEDELLSILCRLGVWVIPHNFKETTNLVYDILSINDSFYQNGNESYEMLSSFKDYLKQNFSGRYDEYIKHLPEYLLDKKLNNPKKALLSLNSFQSILSKRPELIKLLKSNYNIRIRDEDLIARVSYIDRKKEIIVKEDMNLAEAYSLYNASLRTNKCYTLDKLIFKIDGDIPEIRKLKFPSSKKRRTRTHMDWEIGYDVDLTGEISKRIISIAKELCGCQYVSETFARSFIKLIRVYRIKDYDDNKIAELLKIILENRNGDSENELNNKDVSRFVSVLLRKWS